MSQFLDLLDNVQFRPTRASEINREIQSAQPERMVASHVKDRETTEEFNGETTYCPSCGSAVSTEHLFCSKCESFLGETHTRSNTDINPKDPAIYNHQQGFVSTLRAMYRWLRF